MKSLIGRIRLASVLSVAAGSCALSLAPGATAAPLSTGTSARSLTIDERVAARRAIEEVYWRHRIWPKENSSPKPELSNLLSDSDLRAVVEDSLRKSNALGSLFNRPLTAGQLQAEMNRMAGSSRQPDMLRELFAALGNDPFLIAECLVRPALADRLLHSWHEDRSQVVRPDPAQMSDSPGFSEWWQVERARLTASLAAPETRYSLPPVSGGAGCLDDTWQAIFPPPPIGWTGNTTVWTGSEMIVWGGLINPYYTTYTNTGGRYDPAIDIWSPLGKGANLPAARRDATAVWTGTEMIVWGGFVIATTDTGGRYDPLTDTWKPMSAGPGLPSARADHSAIWTGSEMIVWGGQEYGTPLADGARYDPSADSWTPVGLGGSPPAARRDHFALWTGSEMLIWGGALDYSGTLTESGARYDPDSDTWVAIPPPPPGTAMACCGTAVWTGSEAILWGGSLADGNYPLGARYSPGRNTWSSMAMDPYVGIPVTFHSAVWTGSEMLTWGGSGAYGSEFATGSRYDPSGDTWSSMSSAGAPVSRHGHAAVWTGTEMIVWGGTTKPVDEAVTGGRYSPVSDSWVPTSRGAPSGRAGHTAVWTGSEMIVWGGTTLFIGLSTATGGRYDPALDLWSETAPGPGLLLPRSSHSAIWTGTEMIVWGGYPTTNSGGRYDPLTDSWVLTSLAGAPAKRSGHAAVWSGSEMLVWGGLSGSTTLNTGGRYSPAGDSWMPIAVTPSTPSPRVNTRAVWTGSELIVWGGSANAGSGQPLDSGGRYDPAGDLWLSTPISSTSPSPRFEHSAVWTGTEMLVWGGRNSNVKLNSGSSFSPSTGSWTVIPVTADTPSPRSLHSGIWTGTEMLIWGGDDGIYPFAGVATGGRFATATGTWSPTAEFPNAPFPRYVHTTVWTGREAIVWGGGPSKVDTFGGDRYCFAPTCPQPALWYPDFDQDGYGGTISHLLSCTQPPGYLSSAGDCDDSNPAFNPLVPDTSCDGADNDCDGKKDDDYVPLVTSCGVGGCTRSGLLVCSQGAPVDTCTPGYPVYPDDWTCNNIDDDCDGTTDEEFVGTITYCGIGECVNVGLTGCSLGIEFDQCVPLPPSVEACDGLDNDCDGQIDTGCPTTFFPPDAGGIPRGGPRLTFQWYPGAYTHFQVQFSKTQNQFDPYVISGPAFKAGTSWTPSDKKWKRIVHDIAGPNGGLVYWRVVGRINNDPATELPSRTVLFYFQ